MLFLLVMLVFPQDTTMVLSELVVLPAAVALGWRCLREGAVLLHPQKLPQPSGSAQASGSPSAQMCNVNVAAAVHKLLCIFL